MHTASRSSVRPWRLGFGNSMLSTALLSTVLLSTVLLSTVLAGPASAQASAAAGPPVPRAAGVPEPRLSPPDSGWGCGGSIDDLLIGDGVDLGQRAFDLRPLGEGYSLQSFAVREDVDCNGVTEPVLVAASQWMRSSGEQISVNQSVQTGPVTHLIDWGWVTFAADGYAFQLYMPFVWPPEASGDAALAPLIERLEQAKALGAGVPGMAAPRAAAPGAPAWARRDVQCLPGDPRPTPPRPLFRSAKAAKVDVAAEVIARLAPGIDLACFYRRTPGTWEDLGALGLGDPRTAVPETFDEYSFDLSYLEDPAAGCDVPPPLSGEGTYFHSHFNSAAGDWASASAHSVYPGSPPGQGYLDDWAAYWTDERFHYSVYASRPDGTGNRELVEALAATIDHDFSLACLSEGHELTPEEARAFGFRLARPPRGFTESHSQLHAQYASPECANPPPAVFNFYWIFSDGSDLEIYASLYYYEGAPAGDGTVNHGEGYLNWTDADGTVYWVSGYSQSGGDGPTLRQLETVARSMDPHYPGVE